MNRVSTKRILGMGLLLATLLSASWLAATANDWHSSSGAPIKTFECKESKVIGLACFQSGRVLIGIHENAKITVIDCKVSATSTFREGDTKNGARKFLKIPGKDVFYILRHKGDIERWSLEGDPAKLQVEIRFPKPANSPRPLAFSVSHDESLLAIHTGEELSVYDARELRLLSRTAKREFDSDQLLAVSADKKHVFSSSSRQYFIAAIVVATGEVGFTLDPKDGLTPGFHQLVCSEDGKFLAANTWSSSVILWDLQSREIRHRRTLYHGGRAWGGLEFSPDNKKLLTAKATGALLEPSQVGMIDIDRFEPTVVAVSRPPLAIVEQLSNCATAVAFGASNEVVHWGTWEGRILRVDLGAAPVKTN